tara:strand:- start:247 stop:924 length:678 start_codon:yes stop_codon:yes gene_type:complete
MKKKCLIVGSKSSLGNEIKNLFKLKDYEVYGTSRSYKNLIDSKKIFLDFEDEKSINDFSNKIPLIDCLIFSNGILLGKELVDYDDSEFTKVFNINIIGPIKLLKKINNKLNPGCKILFIGSIAGSAGSFDEVYAASKSAINSFVKSLAKKSKNNIRCNCLAPGLIENTTMFKKFSEEDINKHKMQTPTKELNSIKKIAKISFDICQEDWAQLNGQIIDINGGRYV